MFLHSTQMAWVASKFTPFCETHQQHRFSSWGRNETGSDIIGFIRLFYCNFKHQGIYFWPIKDCVTKLMSPVQFTMSSFRATLQGDGWMLFLRWVIKYGLTSSLITSIFESKTEFISENFLANVLFCQTYRKTTQIFSIFYYSSRCLWLYRTDK